MTQQAISNFTNYCNDILEYLKSQEQKVMASVSTVSFDIFVLEALISLQKGVKVIIANKDEQVIPKELDKLLEKHKVDSIQMTPSRMQILLDNINDIPNLKNLTSIILAGEPFSDHLAGSLRQITSARLYNGYGPSETTYVTLEDVTEQENITIGKPMYNTQMYIFKNNKLCPINVPGEIYIGGDNVGLGYFNNPELTKKSFVENPYKENDIIYKSGDIGYHKSNGEIVCLGRIDNQIKIRGLRIELEEIEKQMLKYPNILNCIVDKRVEGTREYLCAYYTKIGDVTISELKQYLLKYLPSYMIPQYFVELQELPYTPNGKIDRKQLLLVKIDRTSNKEKDSSILTEEELKFVNIWKRLLKLDYVSIDDDFFEIGGDSILAITLQIEAMKSGFNIKYEDIFKYKTIRKMLNKDEDTYEFDISNYDYSNINQLISINTREELPNDLKKQELGNILLTGGTGFLGSHIIDDYLKEEKGIIYCLIRGENKEACEKRLQSILKFYFEDKYSNEIGNRIKVLNGDITNNGLHLDVEDLAQIIREIKTVIHSASLVKHYGDEDKFFSNNINGTQNIIDFCREYHKKLVYVSTIGVSGSTQNNEIKFSEKNLYIGQKIKNIYLYTKYIAERLVLEGVMSGLDGIIVRPGNILNRYTDYIFQKNFDENRFIGVLKSFIDIKKIPEDLKNGDIEISPVDYTSSAIIKLLQYPSKCNVFNLINPKTIKFDSIINILKELNLDIEYVETKEFEKFINTIISDEQKSSTLSGIIDNLGSTVDFEFKNNTDIDTNFTEQYLKNIGFEWPILDKGYIKNIIKYFYDIKHFNY